MKFINDTTTRRIGLLLAVLYATAAFSISTPALEAACSLGAACTYYDGNYGYSGTCDQLVSSKNCVCVYGQQSQEQSACEARIE
jgi:hypothetical protein